MNATVMLRLRIAPWYEEWLAGYIERCDHEPELPFTDVVLRCAVEVIGVKAK